MSKIGIGSTKTVKVPKTVLSVRQRPADTFKQVRVSLPPRKGNR